MSIFNAIRNVPGARLAKASVRRIGAALAEKSTVRSAYGPMILRRHGDRTYNSCRTGKYGKFTSGIISEEGKPFVLLDIGANLGIYSLIGAANPNCRKVFAFEPIPATYRYLVGNIELNSAEKVVPVCGALCDGDSTIIPMTFEASHSGTAHIVEVASSGTVYAIALHANHLNELLSAYIDMPIIAKIDVEGAEMSVLAALERSECFSRIEKIIVEVSSVYHDDAERSRLLSWLIDHDFSEEARGQQAGWDLYDALYTRKSTASA